MAFQDAIFYVFAAILVVSATLVISVRNPVHAALWLVSSFFAAAAIWLMLGAEFLAIVLVLVYVGAVMVLFLFVIMMLEINFDELRRNFKSYLPVGAAVGALVLLEMVLVIRVGATAAGSASTATPPVSNTAALGRLLYIDYVYPFELAAVLLLVAIVAAIALTFRKRRGTKSQDAGEQVKVRREDRVRLIRMPSEKREGSD